MDDEDDGHAKQIASEIFCQSTNYKVVIATSKQDNADDLIKSFGEGKGDILIVKQMASLGMDIPSIKIGLDLSAVRTLAAFIQRMMRTATMWGKNKVAHLIIPADVNGSALWNGFIEENGGNQTSHETTLLDSVEKEKSVKDKDSITKIMEVVRIEPTSISDHCGLNKFENSDYNDYAKPLFLAVPKLQQIFTDHEGIVFAKKIGKEGLARLLDNTNNVDPIRDVAEQRRLLKNQIKNFVSEIANKKINHKNDEEKWVREVRDLYNRAKKIAGIHPTTKMSGIANIEKLIVMKDFLKCELESSSSNF